MIIVFDTSALIKFMLMREDSFLSPLPVKGRPVITESTLFEFYGLLNVLLLDDDKKLLEQIQKAEREKRPFLVSNNFGLLPKLHFLVKAEFMEDPYDINPIPSLARINIQAIKQIIKDSLELKQELANGSNKTIGEHEKTALNKAMSNFFQNLEHGRLSRAPINILIPEKNGSIPQDVNDDELFNNQLDYVKAQEKAINLIKISNGAYRIIMVLANEVVMLSIDNLDGVRTPYKDFSEFSSRFHHLLMLLIWNHIHFYKIKYKNEYLTLKEILEPNFAQDIEIILNSICKKNYFISADQGQVEYIKLLFPDKDKVKIEKITRFSKLPNLTLVYLL